MTPVTLKRDCAFFGTKDHQLIALNVKNGSISWRYVLGEQMLSRPTSAANVLLVGQGDNKPLVWDPPAFVVYGAGQNGIHGFSIGTGRQLWYDALDSAPLAAGGEFGDGAVMSDSAGDLFSVQARTGQIRWRSSISADIGVSGFAAAPRTTYIASSFPNKIAAIDERNGHVLWARGLGNSPVDLRDATVTSSGPLVLLAYFVPADNRDREIYEGLEVVQHIAAFATGDGSLQWDLPVDRGAYVSRRPAFLAVGPGTILFSSRLTDTIYAINLRDGRENWSTHLRATPSGPLLLTNSETILAGTREGGLVALSSRDGKVEAEHHVIAGQILDLELWKGRLLVFAASGNIESIPIAQGLSRTK